MSERVFAAGLINSDPRGNLFLRHRELPYEDVESVAEVEPLTRRARRDSRFVGIADPKHLLPTIPSCAGVYGTVADEALAGRVPPTICVDEVVDYPSENRDGWDELTPDSGRHPVVEGTPDFIRSGPSRIISGQFPFEKRDFDLTTEADNDIFASPLWDDLFSIGAGYVPGKGLTNHIEVTIVTDEMRNWLLLSPHLIYVRPIVQRPKGLRAGRTLIPPKRPAHPLGLGPTGG